MSSIREYSGAQKVMPGFLRLQDGSSIVEAMSKHKQKCTILGKRFTGLVGGVLLLATLLFGGGFIQTAYADHTCDDGTPIPHGPSVLQAENFCENHANSQAAALASDCSSLNDCGIIEYVVIAVNILSAIVGVIVVIMVVIGGIQYASARDNAQAVADARQHIINALLALVFYLGITAFLQWLIPGGIFA